MLLNSKRGPKPSLAILTTRSYEVNAECRSVNCLAQENVQQVQVQVIQQHCTGDRAGLRGIQPLAFHHGDRR